MTDALLTNKTNSRAGVKGKPAEAAARAKAQCVIATMYKTKRMRLAAVLAARATTDKEQNDGKEMHPTRAAHLTACLIQAQMKPKPDAQSSDGQNRLTNLAHTERAAAPQDTVLAELKRFLSETVTSDPLLNVPKNVLSGRIGHAANYLGLNVQILRMRAQYCTVNQFRI
eukprot:3572746-Rhodomonas_salina.1